MASETEICNMALSHLGNSSEIASLSENSPEATACNRFYEIARDGMLREFRWPFASRQVVLGLVEEDPNDDWAFSYRYPTDCLMVKRIIGTTRSPAKAQRDKYWIASDTSGRLIYTDVEDAEIEYTARVEDTGMFDPLFTMALSYRVASLVAPRVTGGDPFKLGELVARMHALSLSTAQAASLNEEEQDEEQDSEFIRDR